MLSRPSTMISLKWMPRCRMKCERETRPKQPWNESNILISLLFLARWLKNIEKLLGLNSRMSCKATFTIRKRHHLQSIRVTRAHRKKHRLSQKICTTQLVSPEEIWILFWEILETMILNLTLRETCFKDFWMAHTLARLRTRGSCRTTIPTGQPVTLRLSNGTKIPSSRWVTKDQLKWTIIIAKSISTSRS